MSLYRQLMIIFTLVILIIFAGNFMSNISSTREFLRLQLYSNANDTATSLGLAIKPYLAKNDNSAMTSLVDIVFDRGYFQRIVLFNMADKPVIKREIPIVIKDTPAWFVSMFPLENKAAQASITANWNYSGLIEVKTNPGFAYATFWQNTVEDFYWSLASFFISFTVVAYILHRMLLSLGKIEYQAKKICRKEFVIMDDIPRTREFARITHAMNQLSSIVESTFNELISYSEHMRQEAYADPDSGLYNRRRFKAVVEKALITGASSTEGFIAEIALEGFNNQADLSFVTQKPQLTKTVANCIKKSSDEVEGTVIARVSKGVFRVFLPIASKFEAAIFAKHLHNSLVNVLSDMPVFCKLGVSQYRTGDTYESLNVKLQKTLAKTIAKEGHQWILEVEEGSEDEDLLASLDNLLDGQDVTLVSQTIRACDRSGEIYREMLARVRAPDGSLISANALLPLAKKLGRISDFDKMVLQKAITYLASPAEEYTVVGVNISFQSLRDKEFLAWMLGALIKRKEIASRLVLEISIHDIQSNNEEAVALIKRSRLLGCQIAIEHFGNGLDGFDYLTDLKPQYIKIDGSYIRGIADDKDNQHFVHSITGAAHSLKIQVIAECTENEPDILMLRKLKVDGAQGYLLGRPEPLQMQEVLS